jgi:acetyl esterase
VIVAGLDEEVLAESRAFNEEIARVLAEQPSVHTVPPEVTRLARREGRSIFPAPDFLERARDIRVPARSGEIRARVVPPEGGEATGAYVHIHGGGWVLGCCDEQDVRLAALADATGLCALSVDYRLAPEHPYPAGPDDCEDFAVWLLERGLDELELPDRLAIGGESAGAHLSVTTLLRLRDRHGVVGAFGAANLIYGAYDLSMTPSQRNWGDRYLVLSTPMMHFFGRAFAGDRTTEELRDPDISPLYAELHDLPPALFSVGDQDPLIDDSLFMSARWRAAGNDAELQVWPESIHGFNAYPLRLAQQANAAQYDFLRRTLAN